jgi:hypothetical protein
VTDGQVIASYVGAEHGVEFLSEPGVALADAPASDEGSTLPEMLGRVQWTVARIEFASRS